MDSPHTPICRKVRSLQQTSYVKPNHSVEQLACASGRNNVFWHLEQDSAKNVMYGLQWAKA